MRMIGHVNGDAQARNFQDFLLVQGIDNQVESDKDGSWSVWVHSEEDLDRAKAMLAQFQANPSDVKFQNNERAADEIRDQRRQEQVKYEKRIKERRHLFRPMTAYSFGPVTFILIFISVAVFVRSKFGYNLPAVNGLRISDVDLTGIYSVSIFRAFFARVSNFHLLLPEIRHGEIWRLITPIFMHADFMHIFFNMYVLFDFGSMIEGRQNSLTFIILVLLFAAASNFAQYMVIGPGFLGMSGVNYGLFGYIWLRGKLDPGSGLYVSPSTVTIMIIWFFVCLVGFYGMIANTAHAVGLLTGIAWGAISGFWRGGKKRNG